jgi:hypothetical protein
MRDMIVPSGRVHWIGTGLSTGSGLRVLCDGGAELVVWGRSAEKARRLLVRTGVADRAAAAGYEPARLADVVRAGDVVVSMLPAAEHGPILRSCIDARAHFACSSYTSAEMLATARIAARAGLVLLVEAGLDPGIDHLMAHVMVSRARAAVGERDAVARFRSYCGGIPAVPNEFRYRFSWAPAGVLTALRAPARFIAYGVETVADRPWTATRLERLGDEVFEAYPNRDSLPFIAQYRFPPGWQLDEFVRGTLRLAGWKQAWSGVFEEIARGDDERIAALASDLAARHPTTEEDRDRVVLSVALDLDVRDGGSWSGQYLLDFAGGPGESAMARSVSVALATGIQQILAAAFPPGLHRAADDETQAERWLVQLSEHGLGCVFQAGADRRGADQRQISQQGAVDERPADRAATAAERHPA